MGIFFGSQTSKQQSESENELTRWKKEKQISYDESVSTWWKNNEDRYPVLSRIAKIYLSIQHPKLLVKEHSQLLKECVQLKDQVCLQSMWKCYHFVSKTMWSLKMYLWKFNLNKYVCSHCSLHLQSLKTKSGQLDHYHLSYEIQACLLVSSRFSRETYPRSHEKFSV